MRDDLRRTFNVSIDLVCMNSMMIFAVMAVLLPVLVIYNRRKRK